MKDIDGKIILKVSIVVAAPVVSAAILYLNNLNILEILNTQYLPGFAAFVEDYLFIFLLSAILGKVMEESDDASAMGFGRVISSLPVFKEFLQTLLQLPLNPYLLTGIITNIAAPHNSAYLAMLAYTGLKFKDTYFDYFIVTVLAPLLSFGTAVIFALSF